MSQFTLAAIVLLLISALLLLGYAISRLKKEIPSEDRQYMDPLPPLLRLCWPIIRFLEYHLCARIPSAALERTHERLQRTGVVYLLSAEQFYALRVFSVFASFALCYAMLAMLKQESPWTLLGAVLLGFSLPSIWLSDVQARRVKAVQKTLPVYLDFITMAVEAGLNLTGAINQAMEKGPAGPLRHEFFLVVRDLRSGLSRAESLRRLDGRLGMSEITSFVGTVIQAERMGARLGSALRAQSDQRRTERFQRAEKLAMEAPVKLIGPLMMFIFPVTFIVLFFPIVSKFLNSGLV
ncbi:MAG: type II secretion system F family protein [Pseudomonadota bacterium]